MVDAHNHGEVRFGIRRGNDHPPRTAGQVQVAASLKIARCLDNQVHAQAGPLGHRTIGIAPQDPCLPPVDDDRILTAPDGRLDVGDQDAIVRVVFEQQRTAFGCVRIADPDVGDVQFICVPVVDDLEHLPADASKAIDCHPKCHGLFLFIGCLLEVRYAWSSETLPWHDRNCQVGHAAGVAPLVVVPGNNLDHVAVDNGGELPVDDGGAAVALQVHRHQRILAVAQDALQLPLGGGAQGCVDLLFGHRLLHVGDEVDDGHGGSGHAQCKAVKFAL